MIQRLLSRQSLIHVRADELLDEIFRLVWDIHPNLFGLEVVGALLYGPKDRCVVFSGEWQTARQEDIGDDAEGPKVTPLIILIHQHFRSHVVRRTTDARQVFRLMRLRDVCQPEVNQFSTAMYIVKKNVLRLQIPMRNVESVQVTQAQQALSDYLAGVVFRKLISVE